MLYDFDDMKTFNVINKYFLVFLVFTGLVMGVMAFYVVNFLNLSVEEEWLYFKKRAAAQYAQKLLKADKIKADTTTNNMNAPQKASEPPRTPGELADVHTWVNNDAVMFLPRDPFYTFAFAYSPDRAPEPVKSEHLKNIAPRCQAGAWERDERLSLADSFGPEQSKPNTNPIILL